MVLEAMSNSDRSWVYPAHADFADGSAERATFAVRFKNKDGRWCLGYLGSSAPPRLVGLNSAVFPVRLHVPSCECEPCSPWGFARLVSVLAAASAFKEAFEQARATNKNLTPDGAILCQDMGKLSVAQEAKTTAADTSEASKRTIGFNGVKQR